MAWSVPLYNKSEINKAGRVLVEGLCDGGDLDDDAFPDKFSAALGVIDNWRASHSYPLNTFQIYLRQTARRFESAPLIAQRIKRLVSIGSKLERYPTMRLFQMQDLGGCRAIMESCSKVREVDQYYSHSSQMKHELVRRDDYLNEPKPSGYRGIHLVYQYSSERKEKAVYNGLKIEVQLRSKWQHAFATAVETVGTFSGQALKSSMGSSEWQRFFSIMGSIIAMREKTALVPDTPVKKDELLAELTALANSLHIETRLRGYGEVVQTLLNTAGNAYYFLMELNPAESRLKITGFKKTEMSAASARYADAEKRVKESPGRDAVLVSVDSVTALQRAYPNYFADTTLFVELMNHALKK